MNRIALGLAVGAGYVLGRTKKLKAAIAVGSLVAGKKMNLTPRGLADLVSRQLADNPQFKEIGDQLREDLRGVGKAASGAVVERRIDSLADRLHGRTAQVRDQLAGVVPGRTDAEEAEKADEEPEAEQEEQEEPKDEEAQEEQEEPKDEEAQDEQEAQDEDRGDEGEEPQRKKAAARKTPAKTARKVSGQKTSARTAPARRTATKKTASARKTATQTASGAGGAKGGGER
ncbi:DNA primase [Streptomyces aurantiogriseus]|uniref:DNA primase n=1 Tax=Streptomyces aurantiogriseus TaxID=66870 RepID=A0A918F0C6_9ACTN|nr:DNA primase [Streptomyces aurantiogriseus]GGQ96123.1 hypothetical protein GCM10010251_08580 [Streptomyces aurantiogriseus]